MVRLNITSLTRVTSFPNNSITNPSAMVSSEHSVDNIFDTVDSVDNIFWSTN